MSDDPQNDSKSLGRNIFAENKAPINTRKEEVKKVKEEPPKAKSLGRSMFSSPNTDQGTVDKSHEFDIIEDKPLSDPEPVKKEKKENKKKGKPTGKSKKINAVHISNENVVFAQTFYDGFSYRLINLQVVPIELPKLTEENVFKDKEDPEIANPAYDHATTALSVATGGPLALVEGVISTADTLNNQKSNCPRPSD